ncbi:MAG: IPT/TIG domain-containing protein [Bacteroidia bacterium]
MKTVGLLLLLFIIGFVFFLSCKKQDPDCGTCPCPACPRIDSIIPNHGREGDIVILKGVNFSEDPSLNIIIFNDSIQVQEIQFGTTTELQVVVPTGIKSGPVRIKINDDKALSSDEIPDFNEAVFTLDHFVELVIGTQGMQGTDDGDISTAKLNSPSKIAIDTNFNNTEVYVVDHITSNLSYCRKLSNGNLNTLFVDSSFINDVTPSFNNELFLVNRIITPSFLTTFSRYLFATSNLQFVSTFSTANGRILESINHFFDNSSSINYKIYGVYKASTNKAYLLKYNQVPFINDTLWRYNNAFNLSIDDIEVSESGDFYSLIQDLNLGSGSAIMKIGNNNVSDSIFISADPLKSIAVSKNGIIYFSKDNRVFKVNGITSSTLIAGSSLSGFNEVENTGLNSLFNNIQDIEFSNDNFLYIVDAGNFCIRRLKIE